MWSFGYHTQLVIVDFQTGAWAKGDKEHRARNHRAWNLISAVDSKKSPQKIVLLTVTHSLLCHDPTIRNQNNAPKVPQKNLLHNNSQMNYVADFYGFTMGDNVKLFLFFSSAFCVSSTHRSMSAHFFSLVLSVAVLFFPIFLLKLIWTIFQYLIFREQTAASMIKWWLYRFCHYCSIHLVSAYDAL